MFVRYVGRLSVLVLLLGIQACSSSRYAMEHDAAPEGKFDVSNIPQVVAKWEPKSWRGNTSPYTVRGVQYEVLPSAVGYKEEGISSWYGLKFHGEETSNGEIYNMYELTAAHKTLPLPTYLQVTNVENGKTIVVRVNDRGPFHSDRIIDLSYAAAIKLGFQKKGTARVRLEALTFLDPSLSEEEQGKSKDEFAPFLQIAAFSSEAAAEKAKNELAKLMKQRGLASDKLFFAKAPDRAPALYRLRMGPFETVAEADKALLDVRSMGGAGVIKITRSLNGRAY